MGSEDAGKLIGEKPQRFKKKWPGLAVATVAILFGIIVWQFYYEKFPSIEAASVEKMAYPLPEKTSIAVLPFKNISGESGQEFLADDRLFLYENPVWLFYGIKLSGALLVEFWRLSLKAINKKSSATKPMPN